MATDAPKSSPLVPSEAVISADWEPGFMEVWAVATPGTQNAASQANPNAASAALTKNDSFVRGIGFSMKRMILNLKICFYGVTSRHT
jgi:hypothetical protein